MFWRLWRPSVPHRRYLWQAHSVGRRPKCSQGGRAWEETGEMFPGRPSVGRNGRNVPMDRVPPGTFGGKTAQMRTYVIFTTRHSGNTRKCCQRSRMTSIRPYRMEYKVTAKRRGMSRHGKRRVMSRQTSRQVTANVASGHGKRRVTSRQTSRHVTSRHGKRRVRPRNGKRRGMSGHVTANVEAC